MADDHSQCNADAAVAAGNTTTDIMATALQAAVGDFRRRRLDVDHSFTADPNTITEALAVWLGQEHGYSVAIATCKPLPDTYMRASWPIPGYRIVMVTTRDGELYGVDATWHQLYAYDEEGLRYDGMVPEDVPEEPAIWPLSPRAHSGSVTAFGSHPALGDDLFEIAGHDTVHGATAAVAGHINAITDAFRQWLTPLTGVVPTAALLRRPEPICWDLREALEHAATDTAVLAAGETCRTSLEAAGGHLVSAAGLLMAGLATDAESELAQAVAGINQARTATEATSR